MIRVSALSRRPLGFRTLVTSQQKKRMLNPVQLSGTTPPTGVPPPSGVSPKSPGISKAGAPPPANNPSTMLAVLLGFAAVAGAVYYVNETMTPDINKIMPSILKRDAEKAVEKKQDVATTKETPIIPATAETFTKEPVVSTPIILDEDPEPTQLYNGNRVSLIPFPASMRKAGFGAAPTPQHPADGHRVRSIENSQSTKASPMETKKEDTKSVPKIEKPDAALLDTSMTEQSLNELKKDQHTQVAPSMVEQQTKDKPHAQEDTSNDNVAQLHAKISQLSFELQERTKWEAIRLQEFMAMKEKETADKYLELMHKQRLEWEEVMARRLRDENDRLVSEARAALDAKDAQVQELMNETIRTKEKEYEEVVNVRVAKLGEEIKKSLEEQYHKALHSYKQQEANMLQEKTQALQKLMNQVNSLQEALHNSQTTQAGSSRAHRISAAALALSDKLDTSQGAAQEWQALKIAAGKDGVISTAVATLPPAVKVGVPTLAELQTKFDEMYSQCRQAALVPEGRVTIGGQIAGMVLSTLKYAPQPDDPAPEENLNHPEFVLVRAKKHIQLGELETAIEWIEKLKGQSEFILKDWKKDAMDRIAVDKARKVIKMECALLNESLA